MKLKLLLLLIASSISNLHAAFTLADITTPAKKACTDVASILAKHPGGIAATGFAVGSLMYVHADHEYKKAHQASKRLEKLRTDAQTPNFTLFTEDYKDRSEQLKKAIKEYEEAQTQLSAIEKKHRRFSTGPRSPQNSYV